jgi:hypothetical protein
VWASLFPVLLLSYTRRPLHGAGDSQFHVVKRLGGPRKEDEKREKA